MDIFTLANWCDPTMFEVSRRSFSLLLSLSAYVMAQHSSLVKSRELDYFPIPDEAQGAFCSAITGWYDGCIVPRDNGTFCDGAKLTTLDEPIFIDFIQCYSNPNFGGRSVSFFGETPDEKKVIEFHMIFKTNNTDQYKGINCQDNGSCECSPELLSLKKGFLALGKCENTDDYSCLYEDFWGVEEKCFVPASYEYSDTGIWCSMAAKVHQYGPCDTVLDIPELAYDASCTAITGWYDACAQINDDSEEFCTGTFRSLAKPLFIDLDTCYSNPYFNQHAVTFFGNTGNKVNEYHIIFASEGPDDYRPLECDSLGACKCNDALLRLKEKFDMSGNCENDPNNVFSCLSEGFLGLTDRCFVPATLSSGDGFHCSMAARVEYFGPCDKNEAGFGVAKSPTDVPITSGTSAPNLPTIQPTDPVASPTSEPTDEGTTPEVVIDSAVTSFVISGWWTDCTQPTDTKQDLCHGGTIVEPDGGPIVIDFDSCYSNPNFDPRSVSFFALDKMTGEVVAYHMLFVADSAYALYAPTDCDGGVCSCLLPSALGDLRHLILAKGTCGDNLVSGVNCMREPREGYSQACYVPMIEEVGTSTGNKLYCAMVADIEYLKNNTGDSEVPGEAEQPEEGQGGSSSENASTSSSSVAGAVIGTLLLLVLFVLVFFMVKRVRSIRNNRAKQYGFDTGDDEVSWIPANSHNPKFSTISLAKTRDPAARGRDGLYKSNIPSWSNATNSRPSERPIVGHASSRDNPRHDRHISDLRFTIS